MSVVAPEPTLVLAWDTVRYASFPDCVAAAAPAGYDAIGLSVAEYNRIRTQGWTDDEMRSVLDARGLWIDEVEVLVGFFAEPGPAGVASRPGLAYADPRVARMANHFAITFGARRLQAVGTFDEEPVDDRVVSAFADLCDRVETVGLQVALEFVPYTNIPDLRTAQRIVQEAGRRNGGLCLDTWRFFRGGPHWGDLEKVDADQVFMVQLNDEPIPPLTEDLASDAVHGRAPISVEVYSDRLDRLASSDAAMLRAPKKRGSGRMAERMVEMAEAERVEHVLSHDDTVRLRIALGRIGRTLRNVKTTPTGGLTFPETSILFNVQRSAPVNLGELAASEGLAPPSVTRTVRSLESKKLVRRSSDPDDGRIVLLNLTAKGERLCTAIRESRDEWLANLIDHLEERHVRDLSGVLEALEALSLTVRDMGEETP